MLTILGQRHGSSRKSLPTLASGQTALKTDKASLANSQHSRLQENRSGSNMDERTQGKLHEPTVTVGPAGEHVETGAKKWVDVATA